MRKDPGFSSAGRRHLAQTSVGYPTVLFPTTLLHYWISSSTPLASCTLALSGKGKSKEIATHFGNWKLEIAKSKIPENRFKVDPARGDGSVADFAFDVWPACIMYGALIYSHNPLRRLTLASRLHLTNRLSLRRKRSGVKYFSRAVEHETCYRIPLIIRTHACKQYTRTRHTVSTKVSDTTYFNRMIKRRHEQIVSCRRK